MLRDYQIKCVAEIDKAIQAGKRSPCLVLPTGTGKTRTVLSYLEQHAPSASVMWLTPRKSLIDQTWAEAGHVLTAKYRLQIRTVQSLLGGEPPRADICVVDEAHFFYGTEEWSKIAHFYPNRIAATATPSRADGAPLLELADALVVGPQRRRLVQQGVLPAMRTIAPKSKTDAMMTPKELVSAYQDTTPGERAVVFCRNIQHAADVAREFSRAGIPSEAITSDGTTPAALASHRAQMTRVLTNVFMVSVGYDDPSITCVIIDRQTSSATTYIQMCGRARGAGAKQVTIIDTRGNYAEWGFADEDRVYSLGSKRPMRPKEEGRMEACTSCGLVYRASLYRDQTCTQCQAAQPRQKRKVELKAAKLEERRQTDTMIVKKEFFFMMIGMAKKRGKPLWLAAAAYRKRYGVPAPIEWRAPYGI